MSWEIPDDVSMLKYKESLRPEIQSKIPLLKEFDDLEALMAYAEAVEEELFNDGNGGTLLKEGLNTPVAGSQDRMIANLYAQLDDRSRNQVMSFSSLDTHACLSFFYQF